jgi:hypothetical protein
VHDADWSAIAPGRTTAVVGQSLRKAPPPWRELRVRCDRGVLSALVRRIDVSAARGGLWDAARERLRSSLRRKLYGTAEAIETPGQSLLAAFARLADASAEPAAVVFEGLDGGDAGTLAVLLDIVREPSRLPVALVFVFSGKPARREVAALLRAVRRVEGTDAVQGLAAIDTVSSIAPVRDGMAEEWRRK